MAYAALLCAGRVIEEIMSDDQDFSSFCAKHQMISLHQNITLLQQFLELIPTKFSSMTSQLESQLTNVAYQLEDIIEANMMGFPCDQMLAAGEFCCCVEEITFISKQAEEMKELFKQNKDMSTGGFEPTRSLTVAPSSTKENQVGLDEDFNQICQRLTSREKTLQIIPVVGMGGIGKTMLARAVYENLSKLDHFDSCSWVTVSQEYSIPDVLRGIIPADEHMAEQDPGALIVQVYKSLYGRRFLIVLDDIWDAKVWDGVMNAIPDNRNGSRVLLTTRLSDVAAKIDSSSPLHRMHLLDKDQSFGKEYCPFDFEYAGKMIAENCKGLPLAIVVVAGLLKLNMTMDYWEEVGTNVNEAASSNAEFDRILSLSYNNLPPHLKSCFLYMAAFPEDSLIKTSQLIQLWIAEGFIKPRSPKIDLEAIAEEYLEDLVQRNLVMVMQSKYDGRIRMCSIHDALRELSLRKAKEDKFLQSFMDEDVTLRSAITTQCRRLCDYNAIEFLDDGTCNMSIRSVLFFRRYHHSSELMLITSRFRLLKVLYGVVVYTDTMFSHIFELTNLRLLCFSVLNDIDSVSSFVVPGSISELQKLETLIVTDSNDMWNLPVDIWKIPKLRHIVLPDNCSLIFPAEFSGGYYPVLENLQTLSWAVDLKLTKSVTRRTANLKQLRLILNKYSLVQDCLENLVDLCQLEKLHLKFYLPADISPLVNLVFPGSLKKLSLQGTCSIISWEHMSSILGSLPNLEALQLGEGSVEGSTWEPKEGDFVRLKYLKITGVLDLKHWLAESTHFPCLEMLVMFWVHDLEEIPASIGEIDTLEKLMVRRCSRKVRQSADRIREEQEGFGNYALQVVIADRLW